MNEKVTKEEIEKWLNKLEPVIDSIEPVGSKGNEMLTNMKAYISDCKHFLENGDLVRSFECCIWSWAILEICKDLDVFGE